MIRKAAFAYPYPAYSQYSENFKYEIRYEKRTFDITEDKISGIEFGYPSNRTCELNFALLTCCSSDSKVEYAREVKIRHAAISVLIPVALWIAYTALRVM